ncbi:hypothetical protein ABZ729_34305 [Streptomyces sp. NPDC006678]|uniref:hypothetical protein n=1 Tax=Streptomyces sp. NPDC006678 TaxID=3157185 RepID=UPI00340BB92B
MSEKSHGGSGPSAGTGRAGQPPAKGKGRRTRPQRAQTAPQEGQGHAGREVVVRIGDGHPRCEAGTFDAAALLASVLESVEPAITEGLRSLEGAAADAGGSAEAVAQAIRAAGRQLADAVRAGVVDGMRSRDRHLAQLAVIDRAAAQASALAELQERIDRELALAGLRRISEVTDLAAFNLAGATGTPGSSPAGSDAYELVSPAYVDAETGRTIEHGWIRSLPAGPAPAPGGKLHGSVSRPHKDRHRSESAPSSDAPPEAAGQLHRNGPQEEPAAYSSRQHPGVRARPAAQEPAAEEQTAQHQETRPSGHCTAPGPALCEEPQPEGHGSPAAAHSDTRPAAPEPRTTAHPQSQPGAGCGADTRFDGPGTTEPATEALRTEPDATGPDPAPQAPSSPGARGRGRTAARMPGAVGGVAMPRRYRLQQPGTAQDDDNQQSRSTS